VSTALALVPPKSLTVYKKGDTDISVEIFVGSATEIPLFAPVSL
jgi:hypothetical protein